MATHNNAACDDPLSPVCKLCDKSYQYKDGPLLLPCLHSFCKPCLIEYVKKPAPAADNKMACPTCNDRFHRDIDQFPINLHLSHLARTATYKKQAEGGNVKCQTCKGGVPRNATSFLFSRNKFLCNDCKSDYQRLLEDEDLEFIDLAAYEKGEFKIHSSFPKCQLHKNQELIFFCDTCKALICPYCDLEKHQNHKKILIEEAKAIEKAQLQQQVDTGVHDALGALDGCLQQIQDMRDKVKVSAEVAANNIDKTFNKLIIAMENRRKVLKSKCREIAEGKDDVLSNQMVQVEHLRRKLSFAHLHALNAINIHDPKQILSIKKAIENRLNQALKAYKRQSMELSEDDSINASVELGTLEEDIGKIGSFPGVPDPSQCCVVGLELAIIDREKKMFVNLKDEENNPISRKCPFQYQLRKVGEDPDEYIPPGVTVAHNESGTATLAFTPDQLGEYKLTIMVRNEPIANPFKITAKQLSTRNYSNFQDMQVTYKSIGGFCNGLAVHDNGTVYASDDNTCTVKVFKPNGEETQIGSSDNTGGQLVYGVWGITIIDDTIFVVNNHAVKMYSTDGRYIGQFGGYGYSSGQLRYPWGICTDGKSKVLVAEPENNRIQIFTSQGDFIKSITCLTPPYDVALDPEGNIHAAMHSENCIAIYSEDGNPIMTYDFGGILQNPRAIYIDGEGITLIGTASDNGAIHIADPIGNLIASKQVDCSFAVTMDKKGVVYVAERNNKRLSMHND